jgi:hypothetical protein
MDALRWIGATLLGASILAGVYLASYFVLLNPSFFSSLNIATRTPKYRFGGAIAKEMFRPVNWMDKRIRPEYWHFSVETVDLNLPPPPRWTITPLPPIDD